MEDLGTFDCGLVIAALRSTLHALRDRIGLGDAAQVGARLPFQLRGAYYEDWKQTSGRRRSPDNDDFFDDIARSLPQSSGLGAEAAASATFRILAECVAPRDLAAVIRVLPDEAIFLWPIHALDTH